MAMTLPQLIKNYQIKVWQTQLQKAVADLNTASQLFMVHNGMSVSEYAADSHSLAFKLFQEEFNTILKKNNNHYGSTDEQGNNIGARPYKDKNGKWYGWGLLGSPSANLTALCDASGSFFDGIGRPIAFDDAPQSGKNGPKVCVDINGEKGPNIFGVDYFVFLFTTEGYVIPWGQPHKDNPYTGGSVYTNSIPTGNISEYCKYKPNTSMYAFSCAIYALTNTHPSENGKDYWHDFINGR